tara:strand:- start:169 stop:942 length:774 start_codon:yes stop_codon:yes gene_type:complete
MQFENWFGKKTERAKTIQIMNYIAALRGKGYSSSTLTVSISAIRVYFDWLMLQGIVTSNPAVGIKRRGRKVTRLPTHLTRAELDTLIKQPKKHYDPLVRERDELFIAMMVSTGLRIGEALKVTPSDIDFIEGTIRVMGKSGKEEDIFITTLVYPDLGARLGHYIKKHAKHPALPIFELNRSSASRMLAKWSRKAGISKKVTPHTLRHTFGTLMSTEKKTPIELLRMAMRHSSISTTQEYVHITHTDLKQGLNAAGAL